MHDFSGVDLSMNSLVIASLPSSFSAGELADLTSYVYGGGRLVLASENAENFPSQIGVLNSALSSLGSTITNDNTTYDAGFGTTSNIADNPFTVGVNNINYAFTSSLSGGTVLVQGASGQNLVSYDRIGAGYLFVIADSNLGDGLSNSAYGNGQLFLNFENVSVSAVPLPASAPLFGAALMVLGAFGYGLKRKQIAASA